MLSEATFFSIQAASLTKWSFNPAANQLEITVKDGTTPRYFLMAQPARIVLDLPDTAVGDVSAQQTYPGAAVRQIRVSQFEPGLTRIVMEISPNVSLAPGQVKLEKVGNEAAQASNSRWILQPLITKSLSANAVTVKPSVPSQSRPPVASGERASKPFTATPSIAPSTPSTAIGLKPSIAPPQTSSRKISPQPAESVPATASNPTTGSNPGGKPAIVVPALATVPSSMVPTATPTTAAPGTAATVSSPLISSPSTTSTITATALAPVLPAPPSTAQTDTSLPPTAVSPVDPSMAVDTQGGVAIAVPTPSSPAPEQGAAPQSLAAVTPPSPPPLSASRIEPFRVDRSQTTVNPATVTTTAIEGRSTKPSSAPPAAVPSGFVAAAEIPTTLAAATSTPAPSVSVPPLNTASAVDTPNSDNGQATTAQTRQPDVAFDIPTDGLSTGASTPPSVSVPPPIQVGSPSLGAAPGTSSAIGSVPSVSVFSPNVPIVPPVTVPPLQPTPPFQQPLTPTAPQPYTVQPSYDANTIRQSTSSADLAPPLNVVPLPAPIQPSSAAVPAVTPGYDANTIRQLPTKATPTSIVEFGQPLPAGTAVARASQPFSSPATSQGVRQAFNPTAPNVLLPAGTILNLRYPGDSALLLQPDRPQQEVLVLLTELRDSAGNILAPAGSAVTGRFETTTSGSQFVTQAIAVDGRTISLTAQSDTLDGSRKVEGNNLAVNSGIGLVAGGVLGAVSGSTGLGALGGAAAGAAATLLTAPKPAAIQPGQVVQVRLTQDLRRVE